ncbi:MAG: hypothetical protein II968_03865 [Selenomonadaceae bacterium]|nr:hypothetical protein [Selenomonadaceae bacterium]
MKNFLLERNLLFIGDKSRFIFAKMLTGILPPDYENFSLRLGHGDAASRIQNRENLFDLASFRTPPGIKIFLLRADDETWKDSLEKFSRIILFEEFPLEKDSTRQLIETWNNLPKSRPPLTVVIMDLAHRQGSTDLDRLDDAITEAKNHYEAQGLDVVLFRSYADAINILHRHESLIQKHKKVLSHELEKIYDRMYELEFLYEDFLFDCNDADGCLSLAALNKICSFDSVKTSNRNSFWAAYNDAALKKLFSANTFARGTLNDLAKICGYILTGDFDRKISSERVEQTKLYLLRLLKIKFLDSMSGGKFSGNVSSYEARDVIAYKKLTSDRGGRFYGINAEYGRRLRHFVEQDTKKIMQSTLDDYINNFERVIR